MLSLVKLRINLGFDEISGEVFISSLLNLSITPQLYYDIFDVL